MRALILSHEHFSVMLDSMMRKLIDPPLNRIARGLPLWLSADMMTIIGFGFGLLSFVALLLKTPIFALLAMWASRLADGLDGALARRNPQQDASSEFGGYLDIVSDFLIWALLPLGFIALDSTNAIAASILLSSFAMSMTVFLAFAVLAAKRDMVTQAQGRKSFFYLAGLAEGTETILFFTLAMLMPWHFIPLALIFAGFVYASCIGRIITSWQILR